MTNSTLESIDEHALPLAHLQLSRRAYRGCLNVKCRTIADVVEGLKSGTLSVTSLGKLTAAEVASAVQTLDSVKAGSKVDWEAFWQE